MTAPVLSIAPELEQRALSRQEQARAIKISDQATYAQAAEELRGIVSLRKEIVDHHAPLKSTTHAAWQAAIAAEKRVLEPVAEAERIIKGEIGRYTVEQEHIRREEERRVREEFEARQREAAEQARREQAEATRQHEEQIEREIVDAEERGADAEYIAELASRPAPVVIAEPVFVPAPVVQSRVEPVSGISSREVWSAEITSIVQLAAHVAAHPEHANLIAPNMTALNGMARSLKGALNIPGVRAVAVSSVAARSK